MFPRLVRLGKRNLNVALGITLVFKISPKTCLEAFKLGNESAKEIVVRCSGPQFSNIVMDQCQNPDSKLHVQTSLKESCKVDYSDADVSQTKLESKLS